VARRQDHPVIDLLFIEKSNRIQSGFSGSNKIRLGLCRITGDWLLYYNQEKGVALMVKFLLWCILFVLCWPLAILALIVYPLVWLILLPFRIIGIAVGGALELIASIIRLPARVLNRI
jgi:hypothetical protein